MVGEALSKKISYGIVSKKSLKLFQENKSSQKAEIVSKIMRLWNTYAYRYRTYPQEYERLLAVKIEKDIRPFNEIKVSTLRDYPKVTLFELDDEAELRKMLEEMDIPMLEYHLKRCERLPENYVYVTMDAFIYDSKKQIEKSESSYKISEFAPRADLMHRNSFILN